MIMMLLVALSRLPVDIAPVTAEEAAEVAKEDKTGLRDPFMIWFCKVWL